MTVGGGEARAPLRGRRVETAPLGRAERAGIRAPVSTRPHPRRAQRAGQVDKDESDESANARRRDPTERPAERGLPRIATEAQRPAPRPARLRELGGGRPTEVLERRGGRDRIEVEVNGGGGGGRGGRRVRGRGAGVGGGRGGELGRDGGGGRRAGRFVAGGQGRARRPVRHDWLLLLGLGREVADGVVVPERRRALLASGRNRSGRSEPPRPRAEPTAERQPA